MSFEVLCTCGEKLVVKDEMAGKRAKCKCGKTVHLLPPKAQAVAPRAAAAQRTAAHHPIPKWLKIAMGATAAIVVIGIVSMVVMAVRKPQEAVVAAAAAPTQANAAPAEGAGASAGGEPAAAAMNSTPTTPTTAVSPVAAQATPGGGPPAVPAATVPGANVPAANTPPSPTPAPTAPPPVPGTSPTPTVPPTSPTAASPTLTSPTPSSPTLTSPTPIGPELPNPILPSPGTTSPELPNPILPSPGATSPLPGDPQAAAPGTAITPNELLPPLPVDSTLKWSKNFTAEGGSPDVAFRLYGGEKAPVEFTLNRKFVAIGERVFDLTERKPVGKITGRWGWFEAAKALSPDGKFLARTVHEGGDAGLVKAIEIVSCESGEVVKTLTELIKVPRGQKLPSDPAKGVGVADMEFLAPDRLLAIISLDPYTGGSIWETKTARLVRHFPIDPAFRTYGGRGVSDDAKYFAHQRLPGGVGLYDAVRGKPLRMLNLPKDEHFKAADCWGLAFAPGGLELAALFSVPLDKDHKATHLVCWSIEGKVVFNERLPAELNLLPVVSHQIEFEPGGKGWLVYGKFLYSRDLKRVVWHLDGQIGYPPSRFLSRDLLLVVRDAKTHVELLGVKMPWDKIQAGMSAMASASEATLRAPQGISLSLDLATIQDPQVKADVPKAAAAVLEALGFKPAENQKVSLQVRYTEGPPRSVQAPKLANSPLASLGDSMPVSLGALEAKLLVQGSSEPIWTGALSPRNPIGRIQVSNEIIQKVNFSKVQDGFVCLGIPYFISKDSKAVLPVTTEIGNLGTAPAKP